MDIRHIAEGACDEHGSVCALHFQRAVERAEAAEQQVTELSAERDALRQSISEIRAAVHELTQTLSDKDDAAEDIDD